MASVTVVEHFNVIEISARAMSRVLYPLPDAFFFSELKNDSATALSQQLPRRLMLGAVIGPAEALPVVTAVMTTLIAMYDDLAVRFSAPDRHHQRVERQFAREWVSSTSRPHYGQEIDNHRQIQPALPVRI